MLGSPQGAPALTRPLSAAPPLPAARPPRPGTSPPPAVRAHGRFCRWRAGELLGGTETGRVRDQRAGQDRAGPGRAGQGGRAARALPLCRAASSSRSLRVCTSVSRRFLSWTFCSRTTSFLRASSSLAAAAASPSSGPALAMADPLPSAAAASPHPPATAARGDEDWAARARPAALAVPPARRHPAVSSRPSRCRRPLPPRRGHGRDDGPAQAGWGASVPPLPLGGAGVTRARARRRGPSTLAAGPFPMIGNRAAQ